MIQKASKKPLPSDELTTAEAIKIAKVSRQTIARWIKYGVIDGAGVSRTTTGRFRIKRWALQSALED